MTPSKHTGVLAAAALVAALAAAGCGREDPVDLANGKRLYIGKGTCGACHILDRAGTRGTQGPSLDAAFRSARRAGMNSETIEGIVFRQIAHPRRGSIMPAKLVKGDDAGDVAAYVAEVAGVPGEDTGELAEIGSAEEAKPIAAEGGEVTLPADPEGQLAFVSGSKANPGKATVVTAPVGAVTLKMPNESPIQHNIAIKGAGVNEQGQVVGTGGTSEVTATVESGTYTFYCSVPGHEAGGMKGTLKVG